MYFIICLFLHFFSCVKRDLCKTYVETDLDYGVIIKSFEDDLNEGLNCFDEELYCCNDKNLEEIKPPPQGLCSSFKKRGFSCTEPDQCEKNFQVKSSGWAASCEYDSKFSVCCHEQSFSDTQTNVRSCAQVGFGFQ